MEPKALIAHLRRARSARPRDEEDCLAAFGLPPEIQPGYWRGKYGASDGTTWYLIDPLFFDGFELGRVLTGATARRAPAFANRAALSRFFKSAVAQGPKLLEGPLGPVVRAVADDVLKENPRPNKEAFVASTASIMAMGLLLHHHAHGVSHEWSAPLTGQKLAAPARVAKSIAWKRPEAKQFVDAILAEPDADGPRLVYADWLQERGDPLGEFIQVQCELARFAPKDRERLRARQGELLERYEAVWRKPLAKLRLRRGHGSHRGFVRGFFAEFAGPLGQFLEGSAELERFPLESAQFTDARPAHLKALMKAKPHPTLATVHLEHLGLGRHHQLLAAPFLSGLRELHLTSNSFGDEGLITLAAARFTRLASLSLGYVSATSKGVIALAGAKWMQRVEHLSLQGNEGVDDSVLPHLAKLPKLSHVSALDTAITEAAAAAYPSLRISGVDRKRRGARSS